MPLVNSGPFKNKWPYINGNGFALLYKAEKLDVDPYVRSVPIGEQRTWGRPEKLPNSLVRSPIRAPQSTSEEAGPINIDNDNDWYSSQNRVCGG